MLTADRSPQEIIKSMSIEDAYNTLLLEIDDEQGENIKYYARNGINIQFDIYEWLYETITIKPKKGAVIIKGKKYRLTDIWSEIESRNIIIKNYLLSKVNKKLVVTPRGQ